jgi:intraflagellar transport protein 140
LFALDNGQVYQADALGRCNEIEMNNCGEPIEFLQCYVEKSIVLVITRSMMLIQLTVVDGLMVSTRNAKLSIELNFDNDVLLAPFGHLICMSTKGTLQCFDLVTDENYELKVPPADVNGNLDKVISFASSGHILAACSQDGKCIFWKYDDSLKKWIVIAIKSIGSHNDTASLLCTFTKNTLVLKAELGFTALFVEYCHSANADEIIALQTGSTTVAIFNDENQGAFAVLDTGMKVNGIAMDSKYICIWSDDEIHVYNIDGCRRCELHSEISMRAHSVAINASSLFIAKDQSLLITDMYGVQRLTISIPSSEGQLLHLDASYDQLAVVTRLGTIKTMDITQKEPKLLTVGKSVFENNFHNFDQVLSVKCNPDGTILSLLSESIIGTHQLHFFETKTGTVKSLEAIIENDSLIMSHCWDPVFPKLFACEVRSRDQKMNRIYTLFVSEELEIYVHEDVHISGSSRLMSVNAPSKLLLLRGEGSTISPESSINGEVLHKSLIKGLSDVDVTNTSSLSALVDFIFYLNANDLDKAHLCIQSMRSTEMWNKLARVCVTQNRLDIAQRCLAKMGNGLGVAAVRRADKEAALAEVAIQLGMVSDAERLYKECNRLDLLCNLYRRQGLWKEAIDTCHEGCIEGKSLQSQYTKQLERNYHPDKLLSNHKKSLKSRKKIIKDLYLKGESVESFLQQENDIELLKWYASYVEGNGDIDMAKELYKMANDDLSLIRIACLQGNLNDAFTLVRESNIPVGAYHLARHLEANGDIKGAISCFARCGKYNYAIRLSKTFGIDNEIMNFALQSEKPQRIECAHYLASIGQNENAAELYMKAGDNQKALDIILQLPLEHGSAKLQVDVLGIIDGLEMETSEDVIRQCATLLLRSGCSKKAIQLLQRKGYTTDGILQFSRENEMVLTESIINEILSPYEEKMCKTQLRSIAAICKAQGNHILACKKFTEGGDRSSAMKCLLLTGDTKNIISYAFTSRTKEVYIIAANYLQTL